MEILINTIALEPNRWTAKKIPHFSLKDLMQPIKDAGFEDVEVWQHHLTHTNIDDIRDIWKQADRMGLRFRVVGVYPVLHLDGEEALREERAQMDVIEKAVILGAPLMKIFAGTIRGAEITPQQRLLTAEHLKDWQIVAKENGLTICIELHGNTLFDPVEVGEAFLAEYPGLDIGICYQPYDFTDTAAAVALAERFRGKIMHVHLQGRRRTADGGMEFCLLEEAEIDYRQLLPVILEGNEAVSCGIEFVKGCTAPAEHFQVDLVLENAVRDAEFIRSIVGANG